jgi:hypothetical protein
MQLPDSQTIKRPSFNKNLILALVLLLLGVGLLGWVDNNFVVPLKDLSVPNSGNDFGVFWSGSRTVWQGSNPYLTAPGTTYRNILIENGSNLQPLEPFISPYYLTLFFLPLALIPLNLAAPIWLLIMQAMMVGAILLLIKSAGAKITPRSLLLGLGMALLWRYTFLVMMVGNLSLLLLFAITASYYCSRTGRPYLAGGLATILLVKPQVVFLILPLLLIVPTAPKPGEPATWLNTQTYRRWIGFGVVAALFALYSFILLPGWIGEWLKGVSQTGYSDSVSTNFTVTSLRSLAATIAPDPQWVATLALVMACPLVIGLIWFWWRSRANLNLFPYVLGVAIALNLLVTPYIRDYDSCLLLFPLLFSFFSLRRIESNKSGLFGWHWLYWVLAFLPFPIHLIAAAHSNYAFEIIVPSIVILLTLLVGWQSKSEYGKMRQ